MAWSIVGVGTVAETTSTTLTLTEPAGVANGDLLIACISSRTTATTGITGTNWALAGQRNVNNVLTTTSAAASACMLYRVRSGTPSLSFTLPAGISVAMGRIIAYRTDTGTPAFDLSVNGATAINITAVSLTGLTTTVANDLLVCLAAGGQEATWSNFRATTPATGSGATDTTTAPSTTTWAERADSVTTTGAQTSLGIFDAVKSTAGATGNTLVTASQGAVQTIVTSAFKAVVAGTADAWNTNDKSSAITLASVDKKATISSATASGVRSSTLHLNGDTGAFYAEFVIDDALSGSNPSVGIRSTSGIPQTNTAPYVTVAGNNGNIVLNGGVVGSLGAISFANGDVVSVAWNSGTERIWFRLNGGNWNNDGSANPATGTNGIDISVTEGLYFGLLFSGTAASRAVTVRTELAEYTQAVPSGFTSWMGETPSAGYTLPAVAGSYALTGTVATPKLARVLDAATAGSYALTGTAATLTKSAAVTHYNMPAAAGSYALGGVTAGLYRGCEVLALSASYALSGTTVSLEVGREVAADPGSYALTGQTVSLEFGKEVLALAGTYAVSGAATTLRYDRKPVAVSGSYSLTGTPANLLKVGAKAIIGLPGSYTLTGADAGLVKVTNRVVAAVSGSYSLTGTTASLELGREAQALGGSYGLTGAIVSLEYGREVLALPSSYVLTGQTASLERGYEVAAVSGSYALTGQSTAFARTWKASAVAGSYSLSGLPANLLMVGARAIIGLPGSYTLSGAAATLDYGAAVAVPPVYRSSDGTTYASRSSTTIPAPAGTTDRDILLAGFFIATSTGIPPDDIVAPAGWTQIDVETEVHDPFNFNADFYVFWKRASGEPADYTFTHQTAFTQGAIAAYSGCTPYEDPIDAWSKSSANFGSTATYSGVTTTVDKDKLVLVAHNWDGTGTLTPPSGETERFDSTVYISDEDILVAGATGNRTQSLTSDNPWAGFLVALKTQPAGPVAFNLAAAAGSYALTGSEAKLRTRYVIGEAGAYNITGAEALIGHGLHVAGGSYALTGAAVTLRHLGFGDRLLIGEAGSYALTGAPVSLIWSGEVVEPPITPIIGGGGGTIPKKQLRKAVRELLKREEKRKGRKKPKVLAREILEVIEAKGLGVQEKRIAIRLIGEALRLQYPSLFYSQPLIRDKEQLARAILFVIEAAMQRILDEEEDEEAALLLLSAA